jgi:hypothetical protein
MWSSPVMFGGGMAMEKGFRRRANGKLSGLKNPDASQRR